MALLRLCAYLSAIVALVVGCNAFEDGGTVERRVVCGSVFNAHFRKFWFHFGDEDLVSYRWKGGLDASDLWIRAVLEADQADQLVSSAEQELAKGGYELSGEGLAAFRENVTEPSRTEPKWWDCASALSPETVRVWRHCEPRHRPRITDGHVFFAYDRSQQVLWVWQSVRPTTR